MTGCEEDPPPPPPPATQPNAPATATVDVQHLFRFKADRSLTIPNMIFVIQRDTESGDFALSLTSTGSAPDGSTVIIGEFVRGGAMEKLVGTEVRLFGGKLFTGIGSMIRTPLAVYTPREAVLVLTSLGETEAAGTLKGTFYRFAMPQNAVTRPTEIEVDSSFSARLIVR